MIGKIMLLNKKEKELKEIKRKLDRLHELYKLERKAGYIELEEPEFYGWIKFYDLKESVKKGHSYFYYKGLLNLVYNEVVSTNKNFERRNAFNGESKTLELEPKSFEEEEFDEKVPDKYKDNFRLEVKDYFSWGTFYRRIYVWVLINPWFLKEKVQKYYIKEKKIILPEIESEIKKIEDELWYQKSNLLKKIKSHKKSSYDKIEEKQYYDFLKKLEKRYIIDDLNELEIDTSNTKIKV